LAFAHFFVSHKDVIADFHEAAAVAVRVAMLTKFRVMRCTKIIKHFGVRSTRVANRGIFFVAVPAPPVFAAVIVKNPLAVFDAALVASLFGTDFSLAAAQAFRFEKPLPNTSCLGVFWNAKTLVAGVA